MAMNPRKVGEGLYQPVADINVTPLVDVMLVLLIIFMVTAPMLATGIKVNLPSAKTAQPLETKQPVIVVVAKDGALSVGKDPVSRDELAAKVKAGLGDSNGVVQLRGDRDASYGDVVSVMDELAANGISRIAIVSGPRSRRFAGCRPRQTRRRQRRQTRPRRDRRDSGRARLRAAACPSAMAPPARRPDRDRAPRRRALVRLSGAEAARADGRSDRRHSAGSSASGKPGAAGRRAEAARTIRASARSRRRAGSDRAAASNPGYPASRRAASAACGGATSASHARAATRPSAAGRRAASAAAGVEQPPLPPPETPPPPPAPVELAPPPPPPPPPKPVEVARPKPPPLPRVEAPKPQPKPAPKRSTSGSGAISVRGSRSGRPRRFLDERALERGGERFLAFGLYRGGELRHS